MKNFALTVFLLCITLIHSQDKRIKQTDLVGYWKQGQVIKKENYHVKIYTRTKKDSKKGLSLLHFESEGKYSILFIRKPQKCGNHTYPKNIYGTYNLDNENQEISFSNNLNDSMLVWKIIWIDENSFGKVIPDN
jgi:hypothetical protein